LLAVDDDYAGKAEVEGAGQECGTDCQGHEVTIRDVRLCARNLSGTGHRGKRRLT
jgi:hypothetical protein